LSSVYIANPPQRYHNRFPPPSGMQLQGWDRQHSTRRRETARRILRPPILSTHSISRSLIRMLCTDNEMDSSALRSQGHTAGNRVMTLCSRHCRQRRDSPLGEWGLGCGIQVLSGVIGVEGIRVWCWERGLGMIVGSGFDWFSATWQVY
jgi:hypothetical protein